MVHGIDAETNESTRYAANDDEEDVERVFIGVAHAAAFE